MHTDQLYHLLQQYAANRASEEELALFFGALHHTDEARLQELMAVLASETAADPAYAAAYWEPVIQAAIKNDTQKSFRSITWMRYAAAIILLIVGASIYLWFYNNNLRHSGQSPEVAAVQHNDILPGSERATLTLADGRTITLDSAATGTIAQQGNASVVKLAGGEIRYDLEGLAAGEIQMNNMSTPRGGQYKLTLPDGTKVWLNAESSITYPATFTGRDRQVKIKGEVYMEVAQNKTRPFLVDVDGKSTVQVLGTSFNVNAYGDEADIRTTLVEGSVKVLKGKTGASVMLKPGQQAVQTTSDIAVNTDADIDQTLAWKNGVFSFQDVPMDQIIRQLERWYDIRIQYEHNLPEIRFRGQMDRGVKLSSIIQWFSAMGIKSRLDGKALILNSKE